MICLHAVYHVTLQFPNATAMGSFSNSWFFSFAIQSLVFGEHESVDNKFGSSFVENANGLTPVHEGGIGTPRHATPLGLSGAEQTPYYLYE